jgi:5-methylcytosine-specific restriction endonuclease McrA
LGYKDPDKQREYQNQWIKKRRLKWLEENGPCVKCGSSDDLQVDHIDPDKKFTHRIWSYGLKKRVAELENCQVLCVECHKGKTFVDRGFQRHGEHAYIKKGCRCDECRAANALHSRKYRARKKLREFAA